MMKPTSKTCFASSSGATSVTAASQWSLLARELAPFKKSVMPMRSFDPGFVRRQYARYERAGTPAKSESVTTGYLGDHDHRLRRCRHQAKSLGRRCRGLIDETNRL